MYEELQSIADRYPRKPGSQNYLDITISVLRLDSDFLDELRAYVTEEIEFWSRVPDGPLTELKIEVLQDFDAALNGGAL